MPVPEVIIHLLGDWPAERLHALMVTSRRHLVPELEAEIARTWDVALQRPGVHLFDGPLCRLERASAEHDGLHLHLSPSTYRVFMGTNGHHPEWADVHGPQVMANPLGTSVVLRSSDGQLVFGRRSERVALYPGRAHPFGGMMEPPNGQPKPDVLGEMRRELHEEAGITAFELADLRVIALVEDRRLRQPELVYAAHTHLTAGTIAERLDTHEHTACWLLPDERTAIEAVLTSGEAITPVLAGSLLAWGWRQFGDRWLEAHLATTKAVRQPVSH